MKSDIAASRDIEKLIHQVRGKRIILDTDLASLYEVPTKRLNEQVRRNLDRFPSDFLFQLTQEELNNLRSQIATSSFKHGGRRYLPYAFTEHGVVMAANVLNSKKAIDSSIFVVRTFIKIREFAINYKELAQKLMDLEKKVTKHDQTIASVVIAIRKLIQEPKVAPEPKKRSIGFLAEHEA
jgi:hypothetical protein